MNTFCIQRENSFNPITMKLIQFLLIVMLSSLTSLVSAQDISEGSREFIKKESANALSIVVQGQEKNVEAVLDEKLKKATGEKSKNMKGMRYFSNARLGASGAMDIYFRVEKAGKADKNHSRAVLFLSSGNDNFIDSETNPNEIVAVKELLTGLQLDVEIYELQLAIDDQNKVIEKAIKDHDKMVSDSVKLEEVMAKTLEEMETNKVDRRTQLEVIEQEKVRLADFQDYLYKLQNNGYNQAPDPVSREDPAANTNPEKNEETKTKKNEKKDDGGGR